jgi:hypothetical protein
MRKFRNFIGLPRDKSQWENPRMSIGKQIHTSRHRRQTYTYWEAVGPARDAWNKLGSEIKDFIEDSCIFVPSLTVDICMIGKTEDTAAPMVLVYSMDFNARKEVRKAIEASGIMKNYPSIGLGDTSQYSSFL